MRKCKAIAEELYDKYLKKNFYIERDILFMRSKCAFSILFIISTSVFSQNYIMTNNGNTSACSGVFLDPGGTGNYQNNLNYPNHKM